MLTVAAVVAYSPNVPFANANGAISTRMPLRASVLAMAEGDKPKIVVTGIGVVSGVGSKDEFWNGLLDGRSGLATVSAFDASNFPTTIGAEVKDFEPKKFFENAKTVRSVDRYTHFAVAASRMAVQDADLDLTNVDKSRASQSRSNPCTGCRM